MIDQRDLLHLMHLDNMGVLLPGSWADRVMGLEARSLIFQREEQVTRTDGKKDTALRWRLTPLGLACVKAAQQAAGQRSQQGMPRSTKA